MPDERVRLERGEQPPADIARTELLELYRVLIDEYRFVTRFNWDRTQYYFVLNTAITGLGFTLLTAVKTPPKILVSFIFLLGCVACFLATSTVIKGHEYYRRVVYRKTLVEDLLGRLHTLPSYEFEDARLNLATTDGMGRSSQILTDTAGYLNKPPQPGTITYWLIVVLRTLLVVNAAALVTVIAQYVLEQPF